MIKRWAIPPQRLILIYDDIDTPFGSVRISQTSSAAGHNGLRDVIKHIKADGKHLNTDFVRIRVGIGRHDDNVETSLSDYVLSPLTSVELSRLKNQVANNIQQMLPDVS